MTKDITMHEIKGRGYSTDDGCRVTIIPSGYGKNDCSPGVEIIIREWPDYVVTAEYYDKEKETTYDRCRTTGAKPTGHT